MQTSIPIQATELEDQRHNHRQPTEKYLPDKKVLGNEIIDVLEATDDRSTFPVQTEVDSEQGYFALEYSYTWMRIVLKNRINFSIDFVRSTHPIIDGNNMNHHLQGMRMSGVTERV